MFRKWIIKLDQKYFWVFSIFALSCFLYFIFGRYMFDIMNYIKQMDSATEYTQSLLRSKLFLLDLCPLMAFILPLLCLIDRKRYFSKWLAPITCIGSMVTLFGQIIWETPTNLAEYIFIGTEPNRLYFMMHFLSFLLAIWTLVISSTFKLKEYLFVLIVLVVWLSYVLIMVNSLDIVSNATGLVEFDWVNEYGQYNKVYKFWPINFPWLVVFWYSIALIGNFLIMSIQAKHILFLVNKTMLFNKK
ncbi:MAG: DUF5378 family protein [Mycoplasma sp.]